MLTKAFVTAAAAGLLVASAAQAGENKDKTAAHKDHDAASASTAVNPTASNSYLSAPAMSADTGMSGNVSATVPMSTGDALAAGGTVTIIASTPVADTAENRALYGEPLSATGKRTRPAGN